MTIQLQETQPIRRKCLGSRRGCSLTGTMERESRRAAFTLVELLVVIAIIAILVGLLLPAIQSAREASRATQCKNNLKQMGIAMLLHHDVHRHFPTGGWNYKWVGDPDRGYGLKQPGGWIYNLLSYIEQDALRQLGADGDPGTITQQQRDGTAKLIATPISSFNCPTRRGGTLFPSPNGWEPYNAPVVTRVARTDYAANTGDYYKWGSGGSFPDTLAEGDDPNFNWVDRSNYTGIVYSHNYTRDSDVLDGTSNTIMIGEKYLNPDHYHSGEYKGDNECMYVGEDLDTVRWTSPNQGNNNHPMLDSRGFDSEYHFGSAHPGGAHFVYCDGSVHRISYDIESDTYRLLGNRRDGEPIGQY